MLKFLNPRAATLFGCAILALAGLAALVAWLGTVPPRDGLLHIDGQLQELRLRDAKSGAFEMTLVSSGNLHTVDFDKAHRLVTLAEGGRLRQGVMVALDYFESGRAKKVVDVVLGDERVLSYDVVGRLAAEKAEKDRNSALGLAAIGAGLVLLGGVARLARGSAHDAPPANPDFTIGMLCWLAFYGIALVAILTEPAILHRAWGTHAFGLPIEYVMPLALALVFLPMWPGCMGLASLTLLALRKGRGGKLGLLLELREALRSHDPAQRGTGFRALWFVRYFVSIVAAWIAYATVLGI